MRIGLLKEKANSIFRVEVGPFKVTKEYSRSTGSAHLASEMDGGEWLFAATSRFNPGKEPRYPLNRRLRGLQNRPRPFGEKQISCPYRNFQGR
jgi:hypothetical protein